VLCSYFSCVFAYRIFLFGAFFVFCVFMLCSCFFFVFFCRYFVFFVRLIWISCFLLDSIYLLFLFFSIFFFFFFFFFFLFLAIHQQFADCRNY